MIERDRHILWTVVESYVHDGVPVSSRRVLESGGHPMSTATIRNRMASLERAGYLCKTHTSSGRVPTDDGYRMYVDDILSRGRATSERVATRCRSELRSDSADVTTLMLSASHLLGSASRNFGVVYGAIEEECRVRNIKLVALDGPRVLVVVQISLGYERTAVVRLDRVHGGGTLGEVAEALNRMLQGLTLHEAREVLDRSVRDNVTDVGIVLREVAVNRDSIFSEPPAAEVFFEEQSQLLDGPELADPKNLQQLLRLLHNKPYLKAILAARAADGVEVTIGAENADEALHAFSVVTAGYRMGAARGVLGIIGPTRMRYDLALVLVDAVSRELRAIGEEYFQAG